MINEHAMTSKDIAKMMGERVIDFSPTEKLDSIVLSGLRNNSLPNEYVQTVIDAGYIEIVDERYQLTTECHSYLNGRYGDVMFEIESKWREVANNEARCKEQGRHLESWRSHATSWLRQGLLTIEGTVYHLTDAGKTRAGEWVRCELLRKPSQFGVNVDLNVASLDGVKVGREGEAKIINRKAWNMMRRRIMENLTPDEKIALGMRVPKLRDGDAEVKELVLVACRN